MLRKTYDWVLQQAQTKHAERALFLVAFIESSVFPIPPDVLLMALVLARREKWLRYFAICLAGSVLGGLLGYCIGYGFWEALGPWFLNHVFSQQVFDKVQMLYQKYDFWIVFAAGFTPLPYKVFTITAGVAHIQLPQFMLASVFGRGGRFILVAGLLHHFGAPIKAFIERYLGVLTLVLTALLIGGFVLIKYILH